ncbi:serine/threonine-protein kinase [Streptomyces fulvoviolaceus]|uniref:serine/threonine-protein kinase n=1 Tax=Streptomyces fulvoviolaceus TaxID=285535 RepID=UPI0004C83D9F|nr:serine/threonine-protein kinase [Streptomyces fulvoviolaceus]
MTDQRPTPPYTPASGDAALQQAGATPLQPADPGRIGPYTPLGRLGSGGMGRVYLARPADDSPGLAAVKVIRPEYAEDPQFRRRFEREAGVHGRLRTAYAPELLGTGFEESLLWMATQYVPGLNLADAVRECGPLEPAGVWRLVADLGRALSALAAVGVVHRDLKPSNVILSTRRAHVIDFGISQAVDSSAITGTGSRVGTPAFMSPEYLREGRCDAASDVFSLACALTYAATGHAPFGDGTGVDVMHRVAFEEPKPDIMAEVATVDPALAALLAGCLAKDPAGRPTAQQLIDAGSAALHGHTPSWHEPLGARLLARQQAAALLEQTSAQQTVHLRAPVAPASGENTTPRRRKKPYLALAAGLAVVAVAASAFFLTRPSVEETASVSPTASAEATSDAEPASAPPSSSSSPSPSETEEKAKEKKGKESEAANDGSSGSGGGTDRTPSATATYGGGDGGSSSGGGVSTPTATVTKTTSAPATPAWISQCTYYSGTELTVYGDKNQRVVQVQCMLSKRGYSVGDAGVDGQFGKDTLTAVKQFQSAKALDVDGEVGPNTWAALRSST